MAKNKLFLICLLFLFGSSCGTVPFNHTSNFESATSFFQIKNFSEADNSRWMEDLSATIGTKPLRKLVIPGTHDSGAYNISADSDIAPDSGLTTWLSSYEQLKKSFHDFFSRQKEYRSLLKKFMAGWSKTQDKTIYEQLKAGIRYFDLRLLKRKDGGLFIIHGMYSIDLETILADIRLFAAEHPKEIIILDFNHLYNLASGETVAFEQLKKYLVRENGVSLLVPAEKGINVTLNELWESDKQIITFYADEVLTSRYPELWSREMIFSPWPNKQDIWSLKNSLEEIMAGKLYDVQKENFTCKTLSGNCKQKSSDSLFVLQGIITANPKMISDSLPLFFTLEKAEEKLRKSEFELQELKKALDLAKERFKKSIFFLKPFYSLAIDKLNTNISFKQTEVSLTKFAYRKAKEEYEKKPRNLEQIAKITTPYITEMLRTDWSQQDLNIIITDWFAGTDYLKVIKELNQK